MALLKLPVTQFEAKAVLLPGREANGPPEPGVCVTVSGERFPQRAVQAEVLVGEAVADFTVISVDQRRISGFFRKAPPEGGVVRVRYGDSQEGAVEQRYSAKRVKPLSRNCG